MRIRDQVTDVLTDGLNPKDGLLPDQIPVHVHLGRDSIHLWVTVPRNLRREGPFRFDDVIGAIRNILRRHMT